ncbi:Sigma-fimbriae tip adhesin [Georgfuchsia toluolica]|uniref:Sigma-fimbriae tip adhesin n=1 Tax=Georgfuchsia toluolica TaxID=424218 RepID=A0A916J683_9PROT|nr:spore coat U domain-containing protein [Georgfuchsia toluolica]CAG4884716.1 Sigma-fimbriae tip adhesin [Georgfuchsia toluolica]
MSANSKIRAALPLALALLSGAAGAATTCTLAISNVAFGGYDVFSATSLDTSGSIKVTCTRSGGANPTVTLAIGSGAYGGSTATRKMKMNGGADFLAYNLYKDAGRTSVWGNVSGLDAFTQTLVVPNNSSAQLTATIFGRIPAGQDVMKGTYSDSVVVTVTP